MLLLRKKRLIRRLQITTPGEIKFDRLSLPASALMICSVSAAARHVDVELPNMAALFYRIGAVARPTLSAADLLALPAVGYTDTRPVWTLDAPAESGKYLYYAHPAALNDPVFQYGLFQGGFLDRGVLTIATAQGQQVYRVWRSTNANLGLGVTIQSIH